MATESDILATTLRASRLIGAVLARWPDIELPGCWLAAGAIAQTVWNAAHGRAPESDILDLDVVYFDAADPSRESELQAEARIGALFADYPVKFDVKNQARVHLWYAAKFGYPIAPYASVEAAIASFPTTATAVGVRTGRAALEICAPFGLSDLLGLIVRPNRRQITRAIYEAKVDRWRRCWPRLTIMAWDDAGASTLSQAAPK